MSKYNPKHNFLYYFFEINQDLVNFLRAEDKYKNRTTKKDEQIYSHFGQKMKHTDKYIGIIIEFQERLYFAPLTHDGDKKWFNRDDSCDFELIYDRNKKYVGSILLCKALPLTTNLVRRLKISDIEKNEGLQYADLCADELRFLNSSLIHQKIQLKMRDCIYNKSSPYKEFRVDYNLAAINVAEYNAMLLAKAEEEIKKLKLENN